MNLKCSNKRDDSESVVVIAKDYHKAFGEVWEEILRTISKGAGQVDNLGIQYSYKGVKVLKATKRRHAGGLMVP